MMQAITRLTGVLIVIILTMFAAGHPRVLKARAQSVLATRTASMLAPERHTRGPVEGKAISGTPARQRATGGGARRTGAAGAAGDVKLVVALFRHGVRAPLKEFGTHAAEHSGCDWPALVGDWKVGAEGWADLTPHGRDLATLVGGFYAGQYKGWGTDYKVYLWADVDQRTKATAEAIAQGFKDNGVRNVEVDYLRDQPQDQGKDEKVDPLFHPFKAGCAKVRPEDVSGIVDDIKAHVDRWIAEHSKGFSLLSRTLDCPATAACKGLPSACKPLDKVTDEVNACLTPKDCSAPIKWTGRFSYASSATEAFLLEYGNAMPDDRVGWGRIYPPSAGQSSMKEMLRFHEFYFDKTDRVPILALIQASNLLREISKTIRQEPGGCQHAPLDSKFVGLVGHDTNLASLGSLLRLKWSFDSVALPADTRGLPANDALPAGALAFELLERGGRRFIRLNYVTQSLGQMHWARKGAFRLRVGYYDEHGHLHPSFEMPLERFNQLVDKVLAGSRFLCECRKG